MSIHPVIQLLAISLVRFKFAGQRYMPMADKIDLQQAQLIIQELQKGDFHYGGQEGSSLRKRLNLSRGSRFTSTITTLQPLFDWITSDPHFVGSHSIQEFVHSETDHLKNSSSYLYKVLAKPSNPADKKKFCWGAIMEANAHLSIPSNGKEIKPSLLEELEGYLEDRCKELFGVLSTPPPVRTFIGQEIFRFSLVNHSYEIRPREIIVKKILEYLNLTMRHSINFLHSGSTSLGTIVKRKYESEISLSSIQVSLYLNRTPNLDSVFKFQGFSNNFMFIIEDFGSIIEFNRLKEYNSKSAYESYHCLIVFCIDEENRIVSNRFKEVHKQQMIIRFFGNELKRWTDKMFIKTNNENNIQFEFGKTKLKQKIRIDDFDDSKLKLTKEGNSEEVICIDQENWIVSNHFKEVHKQHIIIRFFSDELKSWTDTIFIKTNKESCNQFEFRETKLRQAIPRDHFGNSKFKSNKEENCEEVIIKERKHSFGNIMWCLN